MLTKDEVSALMSAVADVVKDYVVRATGASMAVLAPRIDALEKREPMPGAPGRDGKDGADGVAELHEMTKVFAEGLREG
jgi:hypothetical protein